MRNNGLWIVIVVCALIIGFLAGFIVGNENLVQLNRGNTTSILDKDRADNLNLAVGTYKTETWNNHSAMLIIRADGSCYYPTGAEGKWWLNQNTLSIILEGNTDVHNAEIVEGGIMLHGHFFQRV